MQGQRLFKNLIKLEFLKHILQVYTIHIVNCKAKKQKYTLTSVYPYHLQGQEHKYLDSVFDKAAHSPPDRHGHSPGKVNKAGHSWAGQSIDRSPTKLIIRPRNQVFFLEIPWIETLTVFFVSKCFIHIVPVREDF